MRFPYRAPTVPGGVGAPAPQRRSGSDYDTAWARRFPARFARLVLLEAAVRPAIAVLAAPERRGLDHLGGVEGPLIFAANHHSHLDAPLVLTSLPEPWRHKVFAGAAADYFFRSRATSAISALALNAIPIERSKVTRRSADAAAELIDDGWSLLIFPEGGRSPDGWGQRFRGGAAYLSLRCGVPVVPMHLAGTGKVLRKGARRPTPGRTTLTFGRPLRPTEGEDSRRFGARLEAEVAALADEVTTDWYAARRRAHAGASPALTGPHAPSWRRAWHLTDRDRRAHPRTRRRWPDLG